MMNTLFSLSVTGFTLFALHYPAAIAAPPHVSGSETETSATQSDRTAPTLFIRGNHRVEQGSLDSVAQASQQPLKVDATNASAQSRMAEVGGQRPDESLHDIQHPIDSPVRHEILASIDLAEALTKQKQLDRALQIRLQAITQYPDYDELYFGLGQTFIEMGQYDEAASAYAQGYEAQVTGNEQSNGFKDLEVASVSGNALAWRDVGDVLTQLSQHQNAIEAYHRAIAIAPDSGQFYKQLAIVQEKEQQFSAAAESYLQAGDKMAFLELPEKIDAYRQSIRLQPNRAETHNRLGELLMEQGDRQKAMLAFQQALKLNPHLGAAQENLAQAQDFSLR